MSQPLASVSQRRFSAFAWVTLAYTLAVILFGAVVRITGSGAGCGQHWPTCHGEVVHLPASTETAIELTHRLTSGLCLPLVLALAIWASLAFPRGRGVRGAALASLGLMCVEALLGAGLVLLELVGQNSSAARAVFMSAHLVSTSALMAALAATVWNARRGPVVRVPRVPPRSAAWVRWCLAALLVVSTSGAITALGDTLYPLPPGASLGDRVLPAGHFLEQLRVAHPLLAVLGAGLTWWVAGRIAEGAAADSAPARWARLTRALTALQLVAGVANVALGAPGWMQVLHLGLATALWTALVFLLLEVREPQQDRATVARLSTARPGAGELLER